MTAISLWADERWADWGIAEFPHVEGIVQHFQDILEHGSIRYNPLETTLGVLSDPTAKVVIPKAPLYKLAFFRPSEAGYGLTDADMAAWNEKHAAIFKEFGAQSVMLCNSGWSNGEWFWWSLEAYPNLEAVIGVRMKTFDSGWYKYVEATSLLGSEFPTG